MITQIFNAVLRTALTSSMLIAAAVAIRFAVSRRAPKSVACLIWAVVALRLALPFEIQTGLFLHDADGTDKLITKTTVPSVKLSQSNLFGGKVLFYTTANSVLYRTSGEAPEVAAEKPGRGIQDRRILGYKNHLIVLDNISGDFPGGSARVTFDGETFSPAGYFM